MDIRPIHSTSDLNAAIAEVGRLWGAAAGTEDGNKLDILATLIDAYEREHFPVAPSTPLEMLEYAVGDMGFTQTELADVVGSRSLASQLLSGSRRISLDAAQAISAAWNIPIQLLVSPTPNAPTRQRRKRAAVRAKELEAA